MKKYGFKRVIAMLMAILMMFSMTNVIAFAEHEETCEHVWNEGETIVSPTCKSVGEKKYTCELCGDNKTEEIPMLSHIAETVPGEPSTCIKNGWSDGKKCSVCDLVMIERTELPLADHSWNEGETVKDATCTEEGKIKYTCTVEGCGATRTETVEVLAHNLDRENGEITLNATCTATGKIAYTCEDCQSVVEEDIPMIDHSPVTDEAVAPTCKETGLTEGSHCSVCNTVLVEQNEVEKLPHTEDVAPGIDPTCVNPGMTEEITCSVCKEVIKKSEVIRPLGHTFEKEIMDESHLATPATCVKVATYYYGCMNCDAIGEKTFEYGSVNSSNHVNTETVEKLDPTCEIDGHNEYIHCLDCDEEINKVVDKKTGHDFEKTETVAPTCTEEGYDLWVCKNGCGSSFKDNHVDALGHTPVTDEAVDPTCVKVGLTEGSHCSVCSDVIVKQNEIPMLEHSYTGEIKAIEDDKHAYKCVNGCEEYGNEEACTDADNNCICDVCSDSIAHKVVTDEAKEATCLETGLTEGSHCSVCNAVLVEQTVTPALDHDFSQWETETEPTCTEKGSKYRVCQRENCGLREDEEIEAKGHEETIISGRPATCTEIGFADRKYCSVCNTFYAGGEPIAALGHITVTDEAIPATCLETGLTEGSHCGRENCNAVLVPQEITDVLEHSYTGAVKVEENDTHSFMCVNGCEEYGNITPCIDEDKNCICDICEDAIEHKVITVEEISATCTESGVSQWSYCENCGKTLVEKSELSPKGHKYDIVKGYAATCSEPGLSDGISCSVCGLVVKAQEEIPATEHKDTKVIIPAKAPTCTEDGNEIGMYCSSCETVLKEATPIQALGHNSDGVLEAVEPTCTVTGKEEGKYCTRCNEVTEAQKEIPALGHVNVYTEYVAPTCTTEGREVGHSCSRCNEVFTSPAVIPALGHSFSDKWTIDKEPTCTEKGEKSFHCENGGCEEKKDITVLDELGHKEVILPRVEATCTESGLEEGKKCSVCEEILVPQNVIPAKNHRFNEESWEVVTPATCVANGEKANTCLNCNEVIRVVIDSIDHDYSGEIKAIDNDKHAYKCVNGCEEYGNEEACTDADNNCICDVCNDPIAHTEVIDEAKDATCLETGLTEGSHCSVCGAVITAQEEVAKLEHSYTGEYVVLDEDKHAQKCVNGCDEHGEEVACTDEDSDCVCDICKDPVAHTLETDEGKAPTCLEAGLTEGSHCSVCGEVITAQEEIAKLDHSYTGDVKVCENDTHSFKCVNGCDEYGEEVPCIDENSDCVCDICEDSIAHTEVIDEAKEATCLETGLTQGSHCSVCGAVITAQEEIAKLEHSYTGEYVALEGDKHAQKCVNGCDGHGEEAACTDENSDCVCDACEDSMEHKFDTDWTETSAPTCVTEGVEENTCTVCNNTITRAIPVIDHSYTGEYVALEGDKHAQKCVNGCDGHGEETACTDENSDCVCDICKDSIAHKFETDWTETLAPTCLAEGEEENICSVCKQTVTQTVAKLEHSYTGDVIAIDDATHAYKCVNGCDGYGASEAHNEVIDNSKEATCLETGLTEGKHCSVCQKVIIQQEETEKLEHSYTGEVKDVDADTHSFKCVNGCDEFGGAEAHEEVIDAAKPSTCVSTGLTEGSHCSVCERVLVQQDEVPVLEHSYTGDVVVLENDTHAFKCVNGCDAVGEAVTCVDEDSDCKCDICKDPIAHKPVTDKAVKPTCTSTGLTEGSHCSVCGETIVAQEIVAKKAHTSDKGTITTKATCTKTGTKTYKCTVCKEVLKTEKIDKVAHTYETVITKATTSKSGSKVTSCTVCGYVKSKYTISKISSVTLSTTSYTYNGNKKTPTVTIKSSKGTKLKEGTDYTVKYSSSSRKNVGTYTVTVTFKGNYGGTKKLTFKIVPKSTSISKLTAGKKSFTAKWSKQSTQTTGYQIQYSTSSKMTNATTKTISKNSTTSQTIKSLKSGKKYYVRIRTYKTVNGSKIYSSWSSVKSVKVK